MDNFIFTLEIVAPVFLITFLGIGLRRVGMINEKFVRDSSSLVFNVALPSLVFVYISDMNLEQTFRFQQVFYITGATIMAFFLIWLVAIPFIRIGEDRGSFVQGSFRSNYAIVGFALISNLFGEQALGKASAILAYTMPLYNLLAIIVLTVTTHAGKLFFKTSFNRIIKNPLILAALIGIPFAYFHIRIHPIFLRTGRYLGSLALPLALLGIGGSLNMTTIKRASSMAIGASVIKLIFLPLIFTWGAVRMGFRGEDLGVMFILFACPTAVASFVMAKAMCANSRLAGNIILMTTLGAPLTITLGITILKSLRLI